MRIQLKILAHPSGKRGCGNHGQAVVEWALMLPIFIPLFVGFMGLAVILFGYVTASSGAREGAGYIIRDPQNVINSQVNQRICDTSAAGLGGSVTGCQNNISSGTLVITVEPSCTATPCTSGRGPNAQISVKVSYRVPIPTLSVSLLAGSSFTFLAPIWVTAQSTMRVDE
jgi:Flp pilus assembly protein TadG